MQPNADDAYSMYGSENGEFLFHWNFLYMDLSRKKSNNI